MERGEITMLSGEAALQRVAPLFAHWEETLIWSALEGRMGQVWACSLADNDIKAACCWVGDFLFLAGEAASLQAQTLLEGLRIELNGRFAILTSQDESWSRPIEQAFADRFKIGERYAIRKDTDCFDRGHLQQLADKLPAGVEIQPICGALYRQALSIDWAADFCSQYRDEADFAKNGVGFVALRNGELVGGASSYTSYSRGIEIQVETRSDCRRMGIASACCARLILECLDRGLYPSWDAANRASVALAERLGYREKGPYNVWYVNGD